MDFVGARWCIVAVAIPRFPEGLLTLDIGDDGFEVRTCLEFIKLYWDASKPCFIRFLRIASDAGVRVDPSFMPCRYVDVVLEPNIQSHCFWKGSQIEFAPKPHKSSRKRGPQSQGEEKQVLVRKVARPRPRPTHTSRDQQLVDSDVDMGEAEASEIDADAFLDDNFDVTTGPDYNDPDQYQSVLEEICQEDDTESNREDRMQLLDLLQEFVGNGENDEGDGPDPDQSDTDQCAPLHPEEQGGLDPPAPAQSSEASGSRPSRPKTVERSSSVARAAGGSAKSSSTSVKAADEATARVTLATAGAKSASLFDESTIFIGQFYIVKRFFPVSFQKFAYLLRSALITDLPCCFFLVVVLAGDCCLNSSKLL